MPSGDPNIAGVYTNNDESLIPFECPAQLEGRSLESITRPSSMSFVITQGNGREAGLDDHRSRLRIRHFPD